MTVRTDDGIPAYLPPATRRWANAAEWAAHALMGRHWWQELRQLRSGLWVARYGHGTPFERTHIMGWGDTEEAAFRQAAAHMAEYDGRALTTAEVAAVLGCSPTTVRDHARRGRLPYLVRGDANKPSHFAPEDVWVLLVKLDKFGEGKSSGS